MKFQFLLKVIIDFLNQLDDPNFNPFEIKNSVSNKSDNGLEIKEDDDLRPEQDEILEDELIKTKLEPKVSTNDNDIDDKDMTSEKDMDPYDKIQKNDRVIQE